MRRKTIRWVITILCATLTVAGGRALAQGKKKLKLAFITNNASDFWTIARAGLQQGRRGIAEREARIQDPG